MKKKINVLVVDDDIVTLELVSLVLEEYTSGKIETYLKSSEAIRIIQDPKATHYDVIISDLMMPLIDGIHVLAAHRESKKAAKFVMLTGNATKEKVLAAKKLNVDEFVSKPFSTSDLLAKLDRLLA